MNCLNCVFDFVLWLFYGVEGGRLKKYFFVLIVWVNFNFCNYIIDIFV